MEIFKQVFSEIKRKQDSVTKDEWETVTALLTAQIERIQNLIDKVEDEVDEEDKDFIFRKEIKEYNEMIRYCKGILEWVNE